MIKQEAMILKKLKNPNIIRFKDYYVTGANRDRFHIVMEYADNGTLKNDIISRTIIKGEEDYKYYTDDEIIRIFS